MRTSKVFALIAAVVALACMSVSAPALAASGTQGASAKPKKGKSPRVRTWIRIINPTQRSILKRGLQVKVNTRVRGPRGSRVLRKPARTKIRGGSVTFDAPKYHSLVRTRPLRIRRSSRRVIRLRLTGFGRKAVASCQARTLRAQIGRRGAVIKLKRTGACAPQAINLSRAADCDFIGQQDGSLCMLPFPDDYYTVDDASTATKKRINFHDAGMPQNASGTPIASGPYNLNDGFSPGQSILVRIPGMDDPAAFSKTDPVPINHQGRYKAANAPVVVIDATTGERWPIWTELDSNASSPAGTVLEIHPAKNFDAKHRYIVALRNMKRADGSTVGAPAGFRYYRDNLPSKKPKINARHRQFENLFQTLRKADIKRANLYLAWDFTVSSDENIAQRMLYIRDDAFSSVLGDSNLADGVVTGAAPAFTVTTVTNNPDPELARRVKGTFTVPCYLTNACQAPAVFDLDANGNPIRHGDYTANFDCIIPRSAVDVSPAPARPSLYGHGLLGSASEVASGSQRTLSDSHDIIQCATDEIGFSGGDVPNTINILADLSKFPQLTDRVQQGLLNELFLGRLLDNPSGFASVNAFHRDPTDALNTPNGVIAPGDGTNITTLDTSKLYYNGNSQGGILGGALTAVSPDFTRASLGVPAMNYSLLLPRSTDFDTYSAILYPSYPNELSRPLALGLIQMLWDRSEPNGYAHRMTGDPLPNTPPHKVLMNVAFGDFQVTNYQADVEARTIGAQVHTPIVYDGRWPDFDAAYGVPRIAGYPFNGSAMVYWDAGPIRPNPSPPLPPDPQTLGNTPPPLGNVSPKKGDALSGSDPHGLPRSTPAEQQMVSDFLRPDNLSQINDTCFGGPCYDSTFAGP